MAPPKLPAGPRRPTTTLPPANGGLRPVVQCSSAVTEQPAGDDDPDPISGLSMTDAASLDRPHPTLCNASLTRP